MEKFTVIFVDDDNKTVLETQEVDRGASVSYGGSQTEKTIDNRNYALVGWIGEEQMENVQSNLNRIWKENHEPWRWRQGSFFGLNTGRITLDMVSY